MITVNLLLTELKNVPKENVPSVIERFILCYDNMCHLDSLKAAREDLNLPPPYNTLWKDVKKVIDGLHLANHK